MEINSCIAYGSVVVGTALAAAYGTWRLAIRPYLERKKPFADLPMAPNSHWKFGHTLTMIFEGFDKWQRQFIDAGGELGRAGYWAGSKRCIMIVRWQDARAVLNTEYWRDSNPIMEKEFLPIIPNTILQMNGKQWKNNRCTFNKCFTPTAMDSYTDAMIEVTDTVCNTLKTCIATNGQYEGEMEVLMKMITTDAFGLATFSKDFRCTKDLQLNEFAKAFESLSNPDVSRTQIRDIVQGYVMSIIRDRQAEKANGIEKHDLLSCIINANSKDGKIVDEEIVRDIAATALFAGYDTTSIALTYALYMISQNPDIAEECLREIGSVKSLKDYKDLIYCKAVITETLRLFPSVFHTVRTVKKDVTLPDGYVIPAETFVTVPIFSMQRDERNFPLPLEFLPERWVSKQTSKDGILGWTERDPTKDTECNGTIPAGNPKAFLTFSAGGRGCPGMKFAVQEATIVFAGLLKEFNFETIEPDYKLSIVRVGPVQRPADRMPMRVTMRKEKGSIQSLQTRALPQ